MNKNSIEVFDTKTACDPLPIPFGDPNVELYNITACIDVKFHTVPCDQRVAAYNSKEGRFDVLGLEMATFMDSYSYCEIDSVLYSADQGAIRWFDTEVRRWKELKGLVGIPKLPHGKSVRLADYGGKMAVLLEMTSLHCCPKMVSCAEIALERCESCHGFVCGDWFDHVLTSYHYGMAKVVAATL